MLAAAAAAVAAGAPSLSRPAPSSVDNVSFDTVDYAEGEDYFKPVLLARLFK